MSNTVIHEYLTWSRFYKQVANGSKTFEIRRIDSNVNIGDTLKLVEIIDGKRDRTGESLLVEVTQILTHKDFPGVAEGYFCMSIRVFGNQNEYLNFENMISKDSIKQLEILAKNQSISKDAVLRKAIATENYIQQELSKGSRILIQKENSDIREIIFR